jgi:hypothetical protein
VTPRTFLAGVKRCYAHDLLEAGVTLPEAAAVSGYSSVRDLLRDKQVCFERPQRCHVREACGGNGI